MKIYPTMTWRRLELHVKVSCMADSKCGGRFQQVLIKLLWVRPLWMQSIKIALGEEEQKDLFGNSMEITSFNGFSCESSNEDININYNNKERQTWTRAIINTTVMKSYFLSRPVDGEGKSVKGYKRRMHNVWKEWYGTEIREQHLFEQARMIKKNECITKLKLENRREGTSKRKRHRSCQ